MGNDASMWYFLSSVPRELGEWYFNAFLPYYASMAEAGAEAAGMGRGTVMMMPPSASGGGHDMKRKCDIRMKFSAGKMTLNISTCTGLPQRTWLL